MQFAPMNYNDGKGWSGETEAIDIVSFVYKQQCLVWFEASHPGLITQTTWTIWFDAYIQWIKEQSYGN